MTTVLLALFLLVLPAGTLLAQAPPMVSAPVSLDLGVGGGITAPTGDLSTTNGTGWNAGAKLRIRSLLPFTLVAGAAYHRLPQTGTDKSDEVWMVGGGMEYALPGIAVSPYLGADLTANMFKNSGTGSSSATRGGIGLGGGILFSLPGFGSFDAGVKYQMLNAIGKEAGEGSLSQVGATVSLMATIL